jgi:hypothetical protein
MKPVKLQSHLLKVLIFCFLTSYAAVFLFAGNYSVRGGTAIALFRSTTAFIVLSVSISAVLCIFVIGVSNGFKYFKASIFSFVFPVGMFALALVDIYRDTNWFKNYGDVYFMKDWINSNIPFSRWLLGTALLIDVFEFINNILFSITAPVFITTASAMCMAFSTHVVLKNFGSKPYIVLPVTTPIWILLSTGYDEYYPFIAGVFLVVALWLLLDRKTTSFNFYFVIAGVLPAIYTGFVLLAAFVLLKLLIEVKKTKDFLIGLFMSATAFLLAIEVSWPEGHSNYLGRLYNDLNAGDTRNIHNYQGSPMSDSLPFYSFRSAFSGFHLRDVLFAMFFSGGVASIVFILLLTRKVGNRVKGVSISQWISIRKLSLPVVFLVWNLLYLLFVQAKLGPVTDIDLFFGQMLVLAIWCGVSLEKVFDEYDFDHRARVITLSAVASMNGPIIAALVIYGIQR